MQRDQVFTVVGLRENGDRVVITKGATRRTAERIVNLLAGSSFGELLIEEDGAGETPRVESGSSTCDDPVPVVH